MQYRNDTAHVVIVAADPPFEVAPGEVVDVDGQVAGLTLIGEDEPRPLVDVHLPEHPVISPAVDGTFTDPAGDPLADDHQQDPEATR